MKYLTYKTESGRQREFTVFIIHGPLGKHAEVQEYIEQKLKMKAVVLISEFNSGWLFENILDAIDRSDCAVAILSPDDKLADGTPKARENAIFEIGYCMSHWKKQYQFYDPFVPVILMKEGSVVLGANFAGFQYIPYDRELLNKSFSHLHAALMKVYAGVKKGPIRDPTGLRRKKLRADLRRIENFCNANDFQWLSFERIRATVDEGFANKYLREMLRAFPNKIMQNTIEGGRPGMRFL
jgi:hypothetical protein